MEKSLTSAFGGKYTFKRVDERRRTDDRLLMCPHCSETLSQADIEIFSRCPYCNFKLELNLELEDFILEPLVEHWMRQQSIIIPIEERYEDGPSSNAQ